MGIESTKNSKNLYNIKKIYKMESKIPLFGFFKTWYNEKKYVL